jgi:hypothetical protein
MDGSVLVKSGGLRLAVLALLNIVLSLRTVVVQLSDRTAARSQAMLYIAVRSYGCSTKHAGFLTKQGHAVKVLTPLSTDSSMLNYYVAQ